MEGFGGRGGDGSSSSSSTTERVNMADVLQLLLPGTTRGHVGGSADYAGGGGRRPEFKCKTCDRRFPTFQALGGHSTSHRRPKPATAGVEAACRPPKVHGCSICGLEFPMGQALGGHMRRHRGEPAEAAPPPQRRACPENPRPPPLATDGVVDWCLDLNQLPPSTAEEEEEEEEGEDVALLTLGLGIRNVTSAPRRSAAAWAAALR